MKREVMKLECNGFRLVCILNYADKFNPFRLYKVWYESGWHRKQIAKYADMKSVLYLVCHTFDIL